MNGRVWVVVALLLCAMGCGESARSVAEAPAPAPVKAVTPIDLYAGTFELEIVWGGTPIHDAKHWSGEMRLEPSATPGLYRGDLVLRCREVTWVVQQDVEVHIDGPLMRIQGSNVRELEKPEGGGYGFDVFEVRESNGLWFSGDASGEHEGTGTVTIRKGGPA